MSYLKIDLGCGSRKKEGTLGIDAWPLPDVDYVLNLEKDPLPFDDASVDYVYSSHCLEHLIQIPKLFAEVSRVCIDGAQLELWTPYAWENSAFIFDHRTFLNEDHYMHFCVWEIGYWQEYFKKRWILKEFTYIIDEKIIVELYKNKINLDFALRYYKGIVREFCAHIEVRSDYQGETVLPQRTFAFDRNSEKYPIESSFSLNGDRAQEIQKAIAWFSPSAQREVERSPLEVLQEQVHQLEAQLQQARATITAMETSKFWKMRKQWFKLKKGLGLAKQEEE